MTSRALTQGTASAKTSNSFENELNRMQYPRSLSRPQGHGRDYRGDVSIAPVPRTPIHRVPPPEAEESKPEVAQPGLLSRVFSWLRGGVAAPKKLQLTETVALGEKRFVAIIHAEGRKYLVGGGTAGVALLTRLDEPVKTIDGLSLSPELLEAMQ
jgi:hypothetical protein